MQGHMGKSQGQSGSRGGRRRTWFLLERPGRAVYAGLGVASLSKSSGFWGTGSSLVVWYLVVG